MKLLFDHNLSPRLVERLSDIFAESSHVRFHGLDRSADRAVWEFARDNRLVLVTKDSDFHDLTLLNGFPPKLIWLRLGNCTTAAIEALLRQHSVDIIEFESDPSAGTLALE